MKKIAALICFSIFALSLSFGESKILQQDGGQMSKEAIQRKERSILILKNENIPYIESLPYIEAEAESKRRTKDEVCFRAISLCVVSLKGEGLEQAAIDKIVKEFQIESKLSPDELEFINKKDPSKHELTQFVWRYEGYWVLLWSLGFVEKLERPEKICDVKRAVTILKDLGREGFLKKAKLRPQSEILDEADLIYRYHWATTEARIKKKEPPSNVNTEVIMERHYVLNWLIGYSDQEWDDITTDT